MLWFINQEDSAMVYKVRDNDPEPYAGSPSHVSAEEPSCSGGTWPRWNGSAWECAADFRGTTWHLPGTQQTITISLLGEEPPAGWAPGAAPAAPEPEGITVEL